MLRKCTLLLLTLAMLLTSCLAEGVPTAEPEETNPFLGLWEVVYYIQQGRIIAPEESGMPTLLTFGAEDVTNHYPNGNANMTACTYTGDTCQAWRFVFTMEGENLIVGRNGACTVVLVRADPMVLNNPFIGEWEVLYTQENGRIYTPADSGFTSQCAIFAAREVQLLTNGRIDGTLPCTYADGACTITMEDYKVVCTIGQDGLLVMSYDGDSITLVSADEVTPEEITRFYGDWEELVLLVDGVVNTRQDRVTNNIMATYTFSRGLVTRTFDIEDLLPITIPVSYQDGQCTIHFDNQPAACFIDENGMMCIKSEDGTLSLLIRAAEPVVRTASARGLLSDVTVTVTLNPDGTIAAITVDASGETTAIARPCTEEAFLSQFIGKTGPFADVDVVSGATFTSNAVLQAVNSLFAGE